MELVIGIQSDCPCCKKTLTALFSPDDLPEEGDVTVCTFCYTPLIFDDCLALRAPTKEEFLENKKQFGLCTLATGEQQGIKRQ